MTLHTKSFKLRKITNKKVIGRVKTINIDNGRGSLIIFINPNKILKNKFVPIYSLTNKVITNFNIQKIYRNPKRNSWELHGHFDKPFKNIFAGLTIKTHQVLRRKLNLPDKVYRYKQKSYTVKIARDKAPMVFIPEGPFVHGSSQLNTLHYTSPVFKDRTLYESGLGIKRTKYISIADYYIDKYEVTIKQFNYFLAQTAMTVPQNYDSKLTANLPVSNLSYTYAKKYCAWAGKRLPTELEWEKAARGKGLNEWINENEVIQYQLNSNKYPIGNIFSMKRCNTLESKYKRLLPVNLLKDESIDFKVIGMCGNAAEWTSSWLVPYRGNTLKHRHFGKRFKVIRGGAFNLPKHYAKSYFRMPGGSPTLSTDYRAGFRCAKDVE